MKKRKNMSLNKFNLIDRSKHFESIAVSKKLEVETVSDKTTGLQYYVIKNVLQNPDAFVEIMQKHNAYGGDVEINTPGYRQLISSLEIPTLTKLYAQLFKEFTSFESKMSSWYYTSGIYHTEMVATNHNNMPRFSPYPLATQLCLSKDANMGLGFFQAVIDPEHVYARYNDEIKGCDEELFNTIFPVYKQQENPEKVKWSNFEGNENWKPYAYEKFEYNSVVIYDPLYFHQIYFEDNKIEDTQYVLSGYLDAPIIQIPFWQAKPAEEEIGEKNLTETEVSDIL